MEDGHALISQKKKICAVLCFMWKETALRVAHQISTCPLGEEMSAVLNSQNMWALGLPVTH